MAISSFGRPPARRSGLSFFNVKLILLLAIVASVVYLMLTPLPEAQQKDYQITKIEVVTRSV